MCYPKRKDHLALNDLTLRLRGGQVNAITGTSGGGKSSKSTCWFTLHLADGFVNAAILALLQRFYDPTSGTITFGGLDSQAIPLGALRSHLAIVSQNSVLFEGDIQFNLSVSTSHPVHIGAKV